MAYFDNDDAVRTMLRRAAIKKVEDDGTQQIVTATGLKGEEFKVYRQQGHGVSSVPPIGSEGFVLALGGRSDRMLFLQGEHKDHRPSKQKAGDTVIYDAHGNAISLVEKNIRLVSGGTITLKGQKIVLDGEVHLGGEGGQLVHRKGDVDSHGDTAQGSASKVYAV
ncbi:phage baseplate assembly protein [Methylobacterium organophilum]|uniref:phage baseplate assembly protein domain-containing protein n=1 Tax=Methylobacterium organophilum TaxID=410 RepID=UPI001F12FDB4|nr:phage baseplate assembly protein [Methylobacterium organophilum]UMY19139.1 phage baseplate assembly protein [Methylobacterium organophilum]